MSTFRQIVENYAGNIEQRRSIDYEGASDRAIDKIKSERTLEGGLKNLIATTKHGYFLSRPDADYAPRNLHPEALTTILRIRNGINPDNQYFGNASNNRNMLNNSFSLIKNNRELNDNDLFHIYSELKAAKKRGYPTEIKNLSIDDKISQVLNHPNAGPMTKAAHTVLTMLDGLENPEWEKEGYRG